MSRREAPEAAAPVRFSGGCLEPTEYGPGAGIGWLRDKAVFGRVVGVSLLSECVLRFRRKVGEKKWARAKLVAAPRSAYLLSGPARTAWEHSIPPVNALRYSVTFRNLREY